MFPEFRLLMFEINFAPGVEAPVPFHVSLAAQGLPCILVRKKSYDELS